MDVSGLPGKFAASLTNVFYCMTDRSEGQSGLKKTDGSPRGAPGALCGVFFLEVL
jgi:hypothetical protein